MSMAPAQEARAVSVVCGSGFRPDCPTYGALPIILAVAAHPSTRGFDIAVAATQEM